MIILSCCSLWIYDYLIHPVSGAQHRASLLLSMGMCCWENFPKEREAQERHLSGRSPKPVSGAKTL